MIVYLNGEFVGREQAMISAFDRGFIFGDGLYEGLRAVDGRVVGLSAHIERLREGMELCRLSGFSPESIGELTGELLRMNRLRDAFVYWQVTRGTPETGRPVRTRLPVDEQRATVFGYAVELPGMSTYDVPAACSASTIQDSRWLHGRVKSISLLANVLGAIEAHEQGSEDAIFVRSGVVAEGLSTNVVLAINGEMVTPSLESAPILAGVTRGILIEEHALGITERAIAEKELSHADEIMLVGTISMVKSVVRLNGCPVGDGNVGPHARALLKRLVEAIVNEIHSAHG